MELKVRTSIFVLGRIIIPSKSLLSIHGFHARLLSTTNVPKTSKPLRILFCGSDSFSCESLIALVKEKKRDPEGIASIDVLVRPGKPHGRGLREIRGVPLKNVAYGMGLTVHEEDTFTGWYLPKPDGKPINLIVAVSFGLFVPPRILDSAEYGGINVHPSLLPQYRGSAPIHHTIMNGDTITGVTLQTLDPHKFDHGTILMQEGFPIPQASTINFNGLLDVVTPKAANLLVRGIKNRVFINPEANQAYRLAPKIKPVDRYIDFEEGLSISVDQKHRALGRLWCYTRTWWSGKNKKRTIFDDCEAVTLPENSWIPEAHLQRVYRVFPKWEYFCTRVYEDPTHPGAIIIPTVERGLGIRFKHILVEGQVLGSAIDAVHRLSNFTQDENHKNEMFMAVALTDLSEDGSTPVLRESSDEFAAKHLAISRKLKINRSRSISLKYDP